MARSQNQAAGVLLLAAGAAIWFAFGFNVFTMFPIAFCALGGILALAARRASDAAVRARRAVRRFVRGVVGR